MRRTNLVLFVIILINFIITDSKAIPCTNKRNERGRCLKFDWCIPSLNAFKLYNQTPDTGTCEEEEVCCIENTRGLKTQEKKCLEYFLSNFEEVYQAPDDPDDEPEKKVLDRCKQSSTPFIVNGNLSAPHEFPHMASIGDSSNNPIDWFCGGSLISEKFVLTAAHCFASRFIPKMVRLGANNLINKNEPKKMDFAVQQTFSHPGYRRSAAYNDIGLVLLRERVKFSPYIRPACLPSEPLDSNVKALLATGWGNTYYKGERSDDLLKVAIDVYDLNLCKQAYGKKYREIRQGVTDNFICLFDKERRKDTCQGDSGGPVQLISKKVYCSYVIYGVTSAGEYCAGELGKPTLYTNVFNYMDWIISIVWR